MMFQFLSNTILNTEIVPHVEKSDGNQERFTKHYCHASILEITSRSKKKKQANKKSSTKNTAILV